MFRAINNLRHAARCAARPIPKPRTIWARNGLRYERNVVRALTAVAQVWHNPWYYFEDDNGPGYICPDAIAFWNLYALVVECKLTYKPDAILKLKQLYCPVISRALGGALRPLLIVKNLNPDASEPGLTIAQALEQPEPLLHWTGRGPIVTMDTKEPLSLRLPAGALTNAPPLL